MKNLSALTTFFITFLFVIYLGVLFGLKVNGLISNKKLVDVSSLPPPSADTQSVSTPTPKPATTLAEGPRTQVPTQQVKSATTQNTAVTGATTLPIVATATDPPSPQTPLPVVDTSTPPPAPADTSTPLPVAPPPTPEPSVPPPSARCIIAISGGQYDVTDFRNIHSGGNIFQCGTDMTAVFLSQHPASYLQKMAKYKV